MKKALLENFITKYNLGGICEAVSLHAQSNTLKTSFASETRDMIGAVSMPNVDLEDGVYHIVETRQLVSLLNVLSDDINVKVERNKDIPYAITFKDDFTKTKFVLADEVVIPKAPGVKGMPTYTVDITLDQRFMQTFLKATGALPAVKTFTVKSDGNQAQIIVGDTGEINTNNVTLNVGASRNAELEPMHFPIAYLRAIVAANKDATGGMLSMSKEGIAHVKFDFPEYKVDYYIAPIAKS